jgi:protein-L-isoaspartate(D-aspartate) O-methyltransferase
MLLCYNSARVLDVGSGSGYLTACFGQMVKPGGSVLGIDIIPQLVQFSNENMKRGNPDLLTDGIVKMIKADGWQVYYPLLLDLSNCINITRSMAW